MTARNGTQARCGSTLVDHVSRRCRACRSIYNRTYRENHRKPEGQRRRSLELHPPTCVFCGLARGNSAATPVYRYPLQRTIYLEGRRKKTIYVATVVLCDACIRDYCVPSPMYVRAHGLRERKWAA